ncbi:tripartite motif-containing protein 3-like [Branchiostoma lanceolatum]|uniref:tripartite motif-containing protein 3-like n=1 Tax=Branchiostoma lanceolatum TaxID=7740 RepID=UPI003452FDDB
MEQGRAQNESAELGGNGHDFRPCQSVNFTVHRVGKQGTKLQELDTPRGLACSDTSCFVVDSGNKRIKVYGRRGVMSGLFSSCQTFSVSNSYWDFPTSWSPQDVAVDSSSADGDHVVYVTDLKEKVVRKFSHSGVYCGVFSDQMLRSPSNIAVDPLNGAVIVTDRESRQVALCKPDGGLIRRFTVPGVPRGVTVSPKTHNILVTVEGVSQPAVYTPEGQAIGESQEHENDVLDHKAADLGDLCVDEEGNIIVADRRNSRILLFDPQRQFVGTLLSRKDGLRDPCGVDLLCDGVVVSDLEQHCLFYVRPGVANTSITKPSQ